jgi:hypothetical protein
MKSIVAAVAVLTLAGCQTTSPLENYIFVRTDGQRLADNPALGSQFELDKTMCLGEVQKSAVGAPIIYYQGLAGAINASMIQDQQQAALIDILRGCMAAKGYVLVPQSQAMATHKAFKANPVKATKPPA